MGSVQSTALWKDANEISSMLNATGYPDNVKSTLVNNWYEAASQSCRYKDSYGHGVSTKFIFSNISGMHYLSRDHLEIVSGKSSTDPDTHFPGEIPPLGITAGFHGKANGAARGSFGCVQYRLEDNSEKTKAFIVVAWAQPWSGACRCYVGVQTSKFDTHDVASRCEDDNIGSTGNVSCVLGDPSLSGPDCVKVWAQTVEGSTAEIFVMIKADVIVKKTLGMSLS